MTIIYLFWSWQMILLLELCSLDIPHSMLLKSFSSLVELLKSLSSDTGDIFSKVSPLDPYTFMYQTLYSLSSHCMSMNREVKMQTSIWAMDGCEVQQHYCNQWW